MMMMIMMMMMILIIIIIIIIIIEIHRRVTKFGSYYVDCSFIFPTYQHEGSCIESAPSSCKKTLDCTVCTAWNLWAN